jgi:hypothetical protein
MKVGPLGTRVPGLVTTTVSVHPSKQRIKKLILAINFTYSRIENVFCPLFTLDVIGLEEEDGANSYILCHL